MYIEHVRLHTHSHCIHPECWVQGPTWGSVYVRLTAHIRQHSVLLQGAYQLHDCVQTSPRFSGTYVWVYSVFPWQLWYIFWNDSHLNNFCLTCHNFNSHAVLFSLWTLSCKVFYVRISSVLFQFITSQRLTMSAPRYLDTLDCRLHILHPVRILWMRLHENSWCCGMTIYRCPTHLFPWNNFEIFSRTWWE